MMDINVDLLQWFMNVLTKSLLVMMLHEHGQRLFQRETNLLLKVQLR